MAGPEGRLEASGEPVVKWTLELAPQLIHALALWERDETKRLGQRVFRERLVDLALDNLPADLDGILATVADLPTPLRHASGEQFGTRVRASVRDKLINLKPELRVGGIKRRLLTAYGIPVADTSKYELDHLVELSSGGSSDVRNLWPEPNVLYTSIGSSFIHNDKDNVEEDLFHAQCAGQASLVVIQKAVSQDWTTAVASLGLPPIPAN